MKAAVVRSAFMTLRLAGVTTGIFLGAATSAGASCLPSTSGQQLKRADAVFVGRVLSVGADGGSASFRVTSVRKGHVSKGAAVHVVADPYPSSVTIDWSPVRGQRWRVYVHRSSKRWTTNDCMGTHRL